MTDKNTTTNTDGGASTNDVNTDGGNFIGRDYNLFIIVTEWSWGKVFENYIFKKAEDIAHVGGKQGEQWEQERDAAIKTIKEQWQAWNWKSAAEAYRQSLLKQFSTIRVLGKSQPVELEGIFTDVYLLDELAARRHYNIDELQKRGEDHMGFHHQKQKRFDGINLIKQDRNLFILGKPGAGKTTFLKYISLKAAQGKLGRIPIFISLKDWSMTKSGSIMPFLVQQFAICNFPDAKPFIEQLLKSGNAIVLFDGLDEVNQEHDERRNLTRLLQDFAKQYSESQCLITCRIAASEYHFDGFQDVEIADFTNAQIRTFATQWFAGQDEKCRKFIKDLYKKDNTGLSELCSIPLLLSMLCLAFDDSMSFPSRRAEIYEDALDALLRKWDTSRSIQRDEIYRGLSHKRKQQMFAYIAAHTFERGDYFLRHRDLEKHITEYLIKLPGIETAADVDSYSVLKAIEAQHGIFVERAKDIYSFSHLTFQEYFMARYIVDNKTQTTKNWIQKHLNDNRWQEVFLLTASLMDDATDFFGDAKGALDNLLKSETKLLLMLNWVDQKSVSMQLPKEQKNLAKLAYIIY